jgi:spoIIIJ-associated protein
MSQSNGNKEELEGRREVRGSEEPADRPRRRRSPAPEPTDLDEQSRQALDLTRGILEKMGMDCRVEWRDPAAESSDIMLQIIGPDSGRIIGKKGQVLTAIQFVVNRAINRPGRDRRYVVVDADGYRSRREDSLANMARRLGQQAVTDGQIITFEPMSPRDRRVVHLALAKFEGVVTRSEGEGDERRVQIIPVRRA